MIINGIKYYPCDPEKHKDCRGYGTSGCYVNGGPCRHTINEEFKKTMKIKLDENAILPTRGHPTDAGLDLYSPLNCWLHPGHHIMIDTGVHVEIPDMHVGLITSKSGLMAKGITSRGTIDSSFRGSIKAVLYNHGTEGYLVRRGDKITQLVILPIDIPEIEVVDELSETDRGDAGFGSTGR